MPIDDIRDVLLRKEPLTLDEFYDIVEQTRCFLARHLGAYSLRQFGSHLVHLGGPLYRVYWDKVLVTGDKRFSLYTRGAFEWDSGAGAVYGITKDNQLLVGWVAYHDVVPTEVNFRETGTLRELCEAVRIHPWRVQRLLREEVQSWISHRDLLLQEAKHFWDMCFSDDRLVERRMTPWQPPPAV